jgi:uncharacterized membrane protein YhaH (DUF805 family)
MNQPLQDAPARRRSLWLVLGCVTVTLACLGVVALLAFWYANDDMLPGSKLVDRPKGAAAVMLAVTGLALAVAALVVAARRRPPRVAVGLVVASLLAVAVGFLVYPRPVEARLVVLDAATGRDEWSVGVAVEDVSGVRAEDGTQLVLEGWRQHPSGETCDAEKLSVTVDLVAQKVVAVEELPTWFPNRAAVPPPPSDPDPSRYKVEPGQRIRICSS